MFGIGTINYKNLAENLIIIIVVGALCGSIGYKAGYNGSTNANKQVIEQLIPTIQKAIDKETIKNEIKNEIDLKIDKIKKSDSLKINIVQDPVNTLKPKSVIIKKNDSIVPEKKRSWFGRLFSKNK